MNYFFTMDMEEIFPKEEEYNLKIETFPNIFWCNNLAILLNINVLK